MIAVPSCRSRGAWTTGTSVDLRLRGRRSALEEIEVAARVGLGNVALVERTVAAVVMRLRLFPGGPRARARRVAPAQLELALGHVELDQIAVANESERPADERFR